MIKVYARSSVYFMSTLFFRAKLIPRRFVKKFKRNNIMLILTVAVYFSFVYVVIVVFIELVVRF